MSKKSEYKFYRIKQLIKLLQGNKNNKKINFMTFNKILIRGNKI